MEDAAIPLREVVGVLQRRWRFILLTTLAVGVGAVLVSFVFLPNEYTAVTYIEVIKSRAGLRTNRDDITALPLDTFVYYVRDAARAKAIMARHDLLDRPEVGDLDAFLQKVRVRQVRNTGLIEVAVTLRSAQVARDVSLDLAKSAIELNNELVDAEKFQSLGLQRREYERVEVQFQDVRQRWLEASETAFAQGLKEQLASLGVLLRNVETERALAAGEWRDREARVAMIQPLFEGPLALRPVLSVTRSLSESQDLKDMLSGVLETAAPRARAFDLLPVHIEVEQINPVHSELMVILETWKAERDGFRAKVDVLDASTAEIFERMREVEVDLARGEVTLTALEQEFEVVTEQLNMQGEYLTQAAALVIAERQDLRLLGDPAVPERKSGPARKLIVLVALLAAAGATTFLSLVVEFAAYAERNNRSRTT